MSKQRKKLKDTAVGKFLAGAGSNIIGSLGDVLPDKGVMGLVKNLIKKDPELPAEDKEKALALLHQDTVEMQEVSKRWQADMKSDSWLSKNTRPLTLVFLTVSMVLLIFIDSTGRSSYSVFFSLNESHIFFVNNRITTTVSLLQE